MTLIEAHAYILEQFFNEIGIGYQGNLKRERINTAETNLMKDCLDINVQSMLKCREEAVEKINKLFGLNISVKLNEAIYKEDEVAPEADEELQVDGVEEDKVEVEENTEDGGETNE